jgi:hypothetical protein
MNPKKYHERFFLERFIEVAALEAKILEEREAPDFIVCVDTRVVGIELTGVFIDSDSSENPLQVRESISSRIVARARDIYDESLAPPMCVSVVFSPGSDLRLLNMHETARSLASFVGTLQLAEWERVMWRPTSLDEPLPKEISYLQALRVPKPEMAHWTVPRAGWVASLSTSTLQLRVDDKARRIKEYSAVVSENWLVVVADGRNPSQLLKPAADFNPHEVSSPFSRTFFFQYPENKFIELAARSATQQGA